jgi:serine/threonine protein kinase
VDKNVGKSCKTCGQVFDPSIAFCPSDGSKLSSELITASSHELIQVTSRHIIEKNSARKKPLASSSPIVIDKPDAENGDQIKIVAREDRDTKGGNKFNSTTGGDAPHDHREHAVPTLIGQTLDNQYEILSVVGKGGMSFVYKANHLLLRKTVAIKTLLPHLTLQATSLQRFQQEAQAASNLKHPNIISIHNFGTTPDGEPYLVMDYVEGSSIADELEKYGFIHVDRAVEIFIQVADALAHAHQRGIIHRDLKPSNILLLEKEGHKDFVNIVDFGIAKMLPQDGVEAISLTQTGEVFGSPLYMSPEQCRGDKLDARSDIYSMGCLMYETLTGRAATAGDNTMEVLYNHIHEIPAPMKAPLTYIPSGLEKIVFKTLAKDPTQRYQTMDQLRDELKAFSLHRKTSLPSMISNAWSLFWLRRKPRTKKDKIILAIAISGFMCAAFFAHQLLSMYWSAAESPASKLPLVWEEDREDHKVYTDGVEDTKGSFDVMLHRRIASDADSNHKPSAEIINDLAGPAEFLAKRKLWKSALQMYQEAYKYSLKYNDYLALRTLTLRMQMAECYVKMQQYEEGARIYEELLGKIAQEVQRNYVDQSVLQYKLGNVFYLEGKWEQGLQLYDQTYRTWTSPPTGYTPAFSFYQLPTNLKSNYDFSLLVSRMATAYQRLYENSVARGQPDHAALANSVHLYKLAAEQWGHLSGVQESNRNTAVALANYALLDHILDKNANLDQEYALVAKRSKQFGSESAYEGVILRDYSDYLFDKGNWLEAATSRLHAWKIFAQLAKADESVRSDVPPDSNSAAQKK